MRKGVIGILLVLALGGLGVSYGRWSKSLQVQMRGTTGGFDLHFGQEELVQTRVLNNEGRVVVEMEAEMLADQKSAAICLNQNLPLELLWDGGYLEIEYPLERMSGGVLPEGQMAVDFSKPDTRASMAGEIQGVCVDGIVYEWKAEEIDFQLDFDVFNRTVRQGGKLYGYLYLKLTDDTVKLLKGADPIVFEMDMEELEITASDFEGELQDGMLVKYNSEIIIYFDQMNRGKSGVISGEEAG